MKAMSLLCFALLVASVPAGAQEREWVRYDELLQMTNLDKFYAAPPSQRDKLRVRGAITFVDRSIKPSDIVFVIVRGEERQRIPVDDDGQFDVPVNSALQKENPMVHTNIAKGTKAQMGFSAFAILPEGQNMSYATLMAGVAQCNDLVKSQAGILRLFAPKFDGVEIHFSKPAQQSLRILTKAGARTFHADANGRLALKQDEALLKENPQVVFSEPPRDVEIIAE